MRFSPRSSPRGRAGLDVAEEYRGRIERRKAAAIRLVSQGGQAVERVMAAPAGYVLAHDSGDIARHCELLSPEPAAGEVRVVVTPTSVASRWHLDVASRDRPGLLAAFTGVLAARELSVVQAVLATWADGAALQAFVIDAETCPDAAELRDALAASLDVALWSAPFGGADVVFDNDGSPLYTRCEVTAPDRPGLLHAIAVAMALAGADIHAASVSTRDEAALDRFDLTDRNDNKLNADIERAIRANLAGGVVAPAQGRRGRGSPLPRRKRLPST